MSAYRVWWIPQLPCRAFFVSVPDVATGMALMDVLAEYDLFQYENKIKPDYANTGGLEEQDEHGNWCDVDTDDMDDAAPFEVIKR